MSSSGGDALAGRRSEARVWLPYADSDMAAVRMALVMNPPLFDIAAYHCQQSAEKLLKALIVLAGRPLRKIHDLETLTEEAEKAWPTVRALLPVVLQITSWGFAYRYPGAGPAFAVPPRRSEIEAAVADVERLRAFLVAELAIKT